MHNNVTEDTAYATSIEIAAPIIPYGGTRAKKQIKNVTICRIPIIISILDLPRLFNIEIMFTVIAAGIIDKARTVNTVSAEAYSCPINERIDFGTTNRATTNGAVRLRLILILLEDRSLFKVLDAGSTI